MLLGVGVGKVADVCVWALGCITVGPAFYSAAIYLTLSKMWVLFLGSGGVFEADVGVL